MKLNSVLKCRDYDCQTIAKDKHSNNNVPSPVIFVIIWNI